LKKINNNEINKKLWQMQNKSNKTLINFFFLLHLARSLFFDGDAVTTGGNVDDDGIELIPGDGECPVTGYGLLLIFAQKNFDLFYANLNNKYFFSK
jgi:hypothetical protein